MRRAGVSAFGISGTNAHLILEQAPAPDTRTDPDAPHAPGQDTGSVGGAAVPILVGGPTTWLVSAQSAAGLAAQTGRLAEWVSARPELDPGDVGWSLARTRTVFEYRAVVVGVGRKELLAGLDALAAGQPAAGVTAGSVPTAGAGRVVFVFPGQGSQWAGMGTELARSCPVFAARLGECAAALAPYVDWDLHRVLAGDPGAPGLERVDVVQPALWAVMVSLAATWQAAGVTPDAVAGHSQGEIAACVTAGILSLQDAAKVVALRSRALAVLAGRGGMASVAEPAGAVRERLAAWDGRLTVAAVNGPSATVVSGDPAALRELADACGADGVRARVLPVDYASHSQQVEELRGQILAALDGITPRKARVPMISAANGELLDGLEVGPGYWYDSLRAPVEFDRVVRVLAASGHRVFIEVSPHPVLTAPITETLDEEVAGSGPGAGPPTVAVTVTVTGTLRRDDGGPARLLTSLAAVHVHGTAVDWAAVLPAGPRVDLPTYTFQRQRYWPRPAHAAGDAAAGLGTVGHPLLGAVVELAAGNGFLLTGQLSLRAQPWLADHAVAGTVLLPGTAFIELAVRAGDAVGCGRVQELTLEAPLALPADGTVQLQVTIGSPDANGQRAVEIYARSADAGLTAQESWTRHASGLLAPGDEAGGFATDFAAWPPRGSEQVQVDNLYERMAADGYGYGPSFRGLRAAWRRNDDIFVEAALPAEAALGADEFGLHPALLDAVLHALSLADATVMNGHHETGTGEIRLPFAWTGVSLHAAGASKLRARLHPVSGGGWSLTVTDGTNTPVLSVDSLALRTVSAAALRAAAGNSHDSLFSVDWTPIPAASEPDEKRWVVLGDDWLGPILAAVRPDVARYRDLAALAAAVATGVRAPDVVLAPAGALAGAGAAGQDAAAAARAETGRVLGLVKEWLAAEGLEAARLVVVTRGAVPAGPGEALEDLAGAAVHGLVRSAQSENPGRLVLADLPTGTGADAGLLAAGLGSGEPELAVRGQAVLGRRLVRPAEGLAQPAGTGPWRLDAAERGSLESLALVLCPEAAAPLKAGQVRVAVRAAGLNFRDVLIGLDMYPGDAQMGSEIAGVVAETGPGVTWPAAGDRVLGIAAGGFGPLAVTDARLLVPVPAGWTFAAAASVPVAYTTAWYALADLARARPGQRLLVHAAAGGVGTAAVAVARHLGLEVFGTASPPKHPVLAAMGLDAAHVASSRSAEFEERFLSATGGAGMDIVLNALAGELTDASLRLLPRGGQFIEMGLTDLRDPAGVAARHPGVAYRPFQTGDAGQDRLGQILARVVTLLAAGDLAPLPLRAWDVRRARDAFRFMSQARHTGKIVLTIPSAPRAPGTVLVTGGTGLIGALTARRLAVAGRAAALVLACRSGPAAPGVPALTADLAQAGTAVHVTACDTADRDALAAVLARIPASVPLTGVVHSAGVLDDGVTASLTPARVDAVMRPKADTAWHLHELTRDLDLESFTLFSSVAATFGTAGQANYAAGNAFLDALAVRRRAIGLPAVSIAWGLWADASAMTGHLGRADEARVARGGMIPLSADAGLSLLDAVAARDDPHLLAARLDIIAIRARAARGEPLSPLWHTLVGNPPRPRTAIAAATAAETLRRQLTGLSEADRDKLLLDLVRSHVAAVIGHASAEAVEPDRTFKELGFDSLTAVELRNRLNTATGLQLPATLVFDYPTPAALSRRLHEETAGQETARQGTGGPAVLEELDRLESALSVTVQNNDGRAKVIMRLEALVNDLRTRTTDNASNYHEIDDATDEEMFSLIDKELGT